MGKLKIDLDMTAEQGDKQEDIILKEMTRGLPSVSAARHEGIRRSPRTQMAFSNIPMPVKEAFEAAARKAGMGLKEYFYHCLRAGGVDIPDYQDLDARRR